MYTHKWAVYYNNETQVASCKKLSVVWSQGPDTWYVISNNCTLNVVVILQKMWAKNTFNISPVLQLRTLHTSNEYPCMYLHLHTATVQKCAEICRTEWVGNSVGNLWRPRDQVGTGHCHGWRRMTDLSWGSRHTTSLHHHPHYTQWSDFAIKAQCTYLLSRRLFPWLSIKRKNI